MKVSEYNAINEVGLYFNMKHKKQWTHKEKCVIALAAVRNETTIQELCAQHHVAPSQVYARQIRYGKLTLPIYATELALCT